ncbi:MAG: 3'(2'),5'-bisphosphate nucleotidase CysQ [Acidobacteriota bacterium]
MTISSPTGLLASVLVLADEAGRTIAALQPQTSEFTAKADGSPVTRADRESHRIIVAGLEALAPGVPIISEEADAPAPESRVGWDEFWLVDPLDGTKEFLAGSPDYTVNIALIQHGQPVLGVVGAPGHDVTYYAVAGQGSWRRRGTGAAVRVFAEPPAPGAALRVAESRSHGSPALDELLRGYRVRERMTLGSSLKFCLVADGTADCYIRLGHTMEWDVAAGDCVFRWAVRDGAPHESPFSYNKPSLRNDGFVVGFLPPRPAVVWFTGLSGAGKSTIATHLRQHLQSLGAEVEVLDGDAIRQAVPGTGFTRPERDAHIRRVGFLASRLEAHGVVVVAALISPYRDSRAFVRSLCHEFVEVHVATSLAECERRDPKGLYARARAGQVPQFSGIDDPYEPPEQAEIVIDAAVVAAAEAAARIVAYLTRPRLASPGQ